MHCINNMNRTNKNRQAEYLQTGKSERTAVRAAKQRSFDFHLTGCSVVLKGINRLF